MPIWSEISQEINKDGGADFDGVRRKYLLKLAQHTQRNVILYATAWIQKEAAPPGTISIGDEDIQALMEVTNGLKGQKLDLILHSPGGSIEAAEAIVAYLRARFSHIRVIVPQLAQSAATMICCAADEIILGKHSFLGPTDPQILVTTQFGPRFFAAQAILDQFDKAKKECADPTQLAVWVPMLSQYGPALLTQCEAALDLSKTLVRTWLSNFMFRRDRKGKEKAEQISEWLADHKDFKSHGRPIARDELKRHKLKVVALEKDKILQDLSLSVFHATTQTFTGTLAAKIVENHTGRAFIKLLPPSPPPIPPESVQKDNPQG